METAVSRQSQTLFERDVVLVADIDVDTAMSIRNALQRFDRDTWFCVLKRNVNDVKCDIIVNNQLGGRIDDVRRVRFTRLAKAMAGLFNDDDHDANQDAKLSQTLDAVTQS